MNKLTPRYDFAMMAAASLQVIAAQANGLELDHRSILRRYSPPQPQAPLKTINPCRCKTCLRIEGTED